MRILSWTLGGKGPDSPEGAALLSRIGGEQPDVVCLADASRDFLDALPGKFGAHGHLIYDEGARWRGDPEGACKVLMWATRPWREARFWPSLSELGGAVSAVADTEIGPVRVLGVCTPYNMAWPAAEETRPPRWSLNIAYLEALKTVVEDMDDDLPLVLAGELNQVIPLSQGSWEAHHALNAALKRLTILTSGALSGSEEAGTCHVAVSSQLRAREVTAIDRMLDGKALADQPGVVVDLEAGGLAIFD
jgi:hypothetical protein